MIMQSPYWMANTVTLLVVIKHGCTVLHAEGVLDMPGNVNASQKHRQDILKGKVSYLTVRTSCLLVPVEPYLRQEMSSTNLHSDRRIVRNEKRIAGVRIRQKADKEAK